MIRTFSLSITIAGLLSATLPVAAFGEIVNESISLNFEKMNTPAKKQSKATKSGSPHEASHSIQQRNAGSKDGGHEVEMDIQVGK